MVLRRVFYFTFLIAYLTCNAYAFTVTNSATVNITLDHNRIIIPLTLFLPGGKTRQVNAWVDNGTPTMSITKRLAGELKLKPIAKESADQGPMMKSPAKVEIGGMTIPLDQSVEVEAGPTVAAGVDAQMSISSAVLHNYDIVIDYPGKKFTIALPGTVKFIGKPVKGFFNPKNYLIQLPAGLDGEHFNLALDVGTPVTLVSAGFISKWMKAHRNWPSVKGAIGVANLWGLDDEPEWQLLRLKSMTFACIGFDDPIAVSFPANRLDYFQKRAGVSTAGLFGAASLLNYQVGIDYLHKTVYFERIAASVPAEMNLVGLTLRPESNGNCTIIGIANQNGQPVLTGILKGDVLKKVNNKSVTGLTMGKVWSLLRGSPGSMYTMTIDRGGKLLTIKVEVKKFLADGS